MTCSVIGNIHIDLILSIIISMVISIFRRGNSNALDNIIFLRSGCKKSLVTRDDRRLVDCWARKL